MKKTFTSLHFKPSTCLAVFTLVLLSLAATMVKAQTASAAPAELSATGDLVRLDWLNSTEYTAVINSEQASTALQLSNPNLKDTEVALFKGYDRMLTYMLADINLHLPIDNLASNNFDKVVLEAPGDPELLKLQVPEFDALYNGLIEKLVRH